MRSSLLRPTTKGKPDSCSHGVRSPGARSAIYQEIQSKQQRHGKEYHHKFHLLLGALLVLGKKVFFGFVGQGKSPSLWFWYRYCYARLERNDRVMASSRSSCPAPYSTWSLHSCIPAASSMNCGIRCSTLCMCRPCS